MTEFLFMRHGQSQANIDNVIASPSSPLTEYGIAQARAEGKKLVNASITKIICSPFVRAKQTAEVVAHEIGISPSSIEIIGSLRERRYGKLVDQPKIHPPEWYCLKDAPTVEPAEELLKRMALCLTMIEKEAQQEKLLVVGHAISGFYLEQAALGKTSPALFNKLPRLDNAEVIPITTFPIVKED